MQKRTLVTFSAEPTLLVELALRFSEGQLLLSWVVERALLPSAGWVEFTESSSLIREASLA